MMGITRVGTREAEGFDEDLDSIEYHDANDTIRRDNSERRKLAMMHRSRSQRYSKGVLVAHH